MPHLTRGFRWDLPDRALCTFFFAPLREGAWRRGGGEGEGIGGEERGGKERGRRQERDEEGRRIGEGEEGGGKDGRGSEFNGRMEKRVTGCGIELRRADCGGLAPCTLT